MPDVPAAAVPPRPPSPKAMGKGLVGRLSGHKPIVYVGVGGVALGIAYYIHKGQQGTGAAGDFPSAQDSSTPIGEGAYDPSSQYTYFPGPAQGAYGGGDFPVASQGQQATADDIIEAFKSGMESVTTIINGLPTGGGAPVTPDPGVAHTPAVETPQPGSVSTLAPPTVTQTPRVTGGEAQPILGSGIFYNPDRKLRYVVKRQYSAAHKRYENFRRYESKLNKGDWGQGGVIPQ